MTKTDALVLAGDVAAELERYGVVACGRRKDGETHLDVFMRDGRALHLPISGEERIEDLVARTLELTELTPDAAPRGPLS